MPHKSMTVKELKSRQDENELEMSMLELTDVPVKEIVCLVLFEQSINVVMQSLIDVHISHDQGGLKRYFSFDFDHSFSAVHKNGRRITKASCFWLGGRKHLYGLATLGSEVRGVTHLNLSVNLLQVLPDDFGLRLTNIVHLDLSDNQLRLLPDNFGDLKNLAHCDLYKNQLETLPLSMAKLSKLKWLDVKDNRLDVHLHKVCGDCIDDAQCKKAATRLVHHLRLQQSAVERDRQNRLTKQKDQDKARQAAQEAEQREQQLAKKREKLRRKQQLDQEMRDKNKTQPPATLPKPNSKDKRKQNGHGPESKPVSGRGCVRTCMSALVRVVLYALLGCVLAVLGLSAVFYHNCTSAEKWVPGSAPLCHDVFEWSASMNMPPKVHLHAQQFASGLGDVMLEAADKVRNYPYKQAADNGMVKAQHTWKLTKKRIGEICVSVSNWVQHNLGPSVREWAALAMDYGTWFWAQLVVTAKWMADEAYFWLRVLIEKCSIAVQWLSERLLHMYEHSDQYWLRAQQYWNSLK